ncbi:MAG TPA: DNA-directed RNA polymerase subunit alpha [Dehalococcoidia bacterium]|nr:DNA-directed RNA polymerase subunit alpha [Dehalococcoidia bacterium]
MLEPQLYRGAGAVTTQQPPDEALIEVEESTDDYARIVASPLLPGFGITLGNALRRVLLSSLPGAAVASVRVDGVQHEFSTIPGVKEDSIEFLLNVKEIRLRALSDRPGMLVLDLNGRGGTVTAADIQVPEHYEIVNPDLHLATLDDDKTRLYVEFNVEQGRGYVPAGESSEGTQLGVIPVDSIFSPVRKVNYRIEHTRVGQATNYDKLTIELWTDGTLTAVEAVSKSADILIDQFKLFSHMGRPTMPTVERGLGAGIQLSPDRYNMAIEDLNLSMRAYNCLRRSGLMTVGQVLEKSEEELLALRNFGRKSYDELRERLDELGLLSADRGGDEDIPDALPLDDDESPMSALRAEPEPEAGEAAPENDLEPPPVGRRGRKTRAPATDEEESGDEEIPDWKRKLLELTDEEEA